MGEEQVERRLAAILAADVVGYSRLIEKDDAGTLAALKSRRRTVLEPLVARYQGRIFKTTGDGVLVEFASAVNAVQCAIDLQNGMTAANGDRPEGPQIVLRIGVNLGEVMIEGSDLYGDGVNIAARLESIAQPGDILLASTAHDHVKHKIKTGFEDLGPQGLKNISEPVRAYRVAGTPSIATAAPRTDKPAIAVLPFTNMSGDPEQAYFSDGIAEDIITELARSRSLQVIARNSSFQFRGPATDIAAVRRALGVRYVLEGSVRKAGGRVRVTAQLIDAATQSHVWAERYDREIQDIFAVQDEVTRAIVATLEGRIMASGAEQARRKPTKEWAAYDHFLQGRDCDHRYDTHQSIANFRRATELDPDYMQAHAWLAVQLCMRYLLDEREETLQEATWHAHRALELDESSAYAHGSMGWILLRSGQTEAAGQYFRRAVELSPNELGLAIDLANWLMYMNRLDEALRELDLLLQRDPYPPTYIWEVRGETLYFLKRYGDAIASLRKLHAGHHWGPMFLAAAFAQSGQMEEARRELAGLLKAKPAATLRSLTKGLHYADKSMSDHLLEGLRIAGLPE